MAALRRTGRRTGRARSASANAEANGAGGANGPAAEPAARAAARAAAEAAASAAAEAETAAEAAAEAAETAAEAAADAGVEGPAPSAGTPRVRDRAWMLALLPAFPVMLLVLRLWYQSRQDLPTMLLLVQYASPLGPISALLITLIWVFPVAVLVAASLGAMLRASTPDALRSRLGRASARLPDWVVLLSVLVAALTWQLRFLPALVMLTLMVLGLEVRIRHGDRAWSVLGLGLPAVVAVAEFGWTGPALADAVRAGEQVTVLLLGVPPLATLALTGRIPARMARSVTSGSAMAAGLLAPFMLAAVFLRTPVLPVTALQLSGASAGEPDRVLRGFVINVDDTMTTVLDEDGTVHFLPNAQVVSKILCPDSGEPPSSQVDVHGWPVEETALEWIAPHRVPTAVDSRCQGRPVDRAR
jgi:hypothetical protein